MSMSPKSLSVTGLKIMSLISILLSAVSCSKEGVKQFQGYYSYKTSGTVTLTAVEETSEDSSEGTTLGPNTLTLELESETGQMNIVTRSSKEGTMLITMNPIGSGVSTYEMTLKEGHLVSGEEARSLKFKDLIATSQLNLNVSLDAEKVGDIVLILHNISGEMSYLERTYTVSSSDVKTVAKEN